MEPVNYDIATLSHLRQGSLDLSAPGQRPLLETRENSELLGRGIVCRTILDIF
jgi:hypothetical protein